MILYYILGVDKEYENRYRKYLSSKLARLVARRRLLLTRYDRNDPTLKDRLRKIEKENRHLRITVLRLKRMQRGAFRQTWSRNNDNAPDVSHVGIQIPISNELDTNESEVRAPNIVPPTSSRAHPPGNKHLANYVLYTNFLQTIEIHNYNLNLNNFR